MRVIILGSNSFSGQAFINYLLKKSISVIGISRSNLKKDHFLSFSKNNKKFIFFKLDINKNQRDILKLINKYKPDYLINYSSQSMVGESWNSPEDWFYTNSFSLPVLYNKIYDLNIIKRLVHISTPEVYGSSNKILKENNNFNPSTPYAVSRTTSDMYLNILHQFKGYDFVTTRASNVYGEFQDLYRIIPKTIFNFMSKNKIYLDGGGLSKRSFIHIDDVSEATYLIMKKGMSGSTYHISTNEFISIYNLAKKISILMKKDHKEYISKLKNDRIGKDQYYKLNSDKLKNLGWKPKVSLDNGILRTHNWIYENFKNFLSKDKIYSHKK